MPELHADGRYGDGMVLYFGNGRAETLLLLLLLLTRGGHLEFVCRNTGSL